MSLSVELTHRWNSDQGCDSIFLALDAGGARKRMEITLPLSDAETLGDALIAIVRLAEARALERASREPKQ